jgi:hypothetical protein
MASKASDAPMCPICEHAHWSHQKHIWGKETNGPKCDDVPSGEEAQSEGTETSVAPDPAGPSAPSEVVAEGPPDPQVAIVAKPKTDRKEYLKIKAREFRARESAAAKSAGLTVAEYRKRK